MIDEGARVAAAIGTRPVIVHAKVARAAALLARGDVRAAADHAAEAAQASHEATMTGHEIVALARQARALAEAGAGRSAAAAFAHAGDRERAETLRERARQGVLRKLRELPDPIWRAAFEMIEENRYLLR
jgi:hypothetical protein